MAAVLLSLAAVAAVWSRTLQAPTASAAPDASSSLSEGKLCVTKEYIEGELPENCGNINKPVPAPFDLNVSSYNFNTSLYWKYTGPADAHFMVEILKHGQKNWTTFEPCRNISRHNCNLSSKITDPFVYYKARVKAIVGNKESKYISKEFTLVNVGIIGPPSVNGSIHQDKMIVIDIWHPSIFSTSGKKTIGDYALFNYIVFYGGNMEETDDCDDQGCSAEILIKDQLLCFYVQGKSHDLPMTTKMSEKICIIDKEDEGTPVQTIVIIIVVVTGVLLLPIIIGYVIYRKMAKYRNSTPQSLSSVTRNFTSRFLPQYMPRYDHVITSPIETPVEQKTSVNEEQVSGDVSAQTVSNGSAYPPYQSTVAESSLKSEEDGEDTNCNKTEKGGEEANCSNGYFHKNCNRSDSNNSLEPKKEGDLSREEPEPSRVVRAVANSFGYDKPHFPKV